MAHWGLSRQKQRNIKLDYPVQLVNCKVIVWMRYHAIKITHNAIQLAFFYMLYKPVDDLIDSKRVSLL